MSQENVFRVVRRRARPGCAPAYEALVSAMFASARQFPGYLSAELIPPADADGEYQIVQRFATMADLEHWQDSAERAEWMERIARVADGDPQYRLLHGLEAWFGPVVAPTRVPPRWRLTVVSWLGIFPTVALLLGFVAPLMADWPFLLRVAAITAMVAVLMSYLIMPRLTRWFGWWLRR